MREAGVLMPVASLPGAYGIGDLGPGCDAFVDWLAATGASVWQILPLNPLGYGNSPYQPFSSYAGDSLYISLEMLHREGLLETLPAPFRAEAAQIDYTAVRAYKEPFLRRAYQNFTPDEEYRHFTAQEWVYPYAVFRALKAQNGQRCWLDWPKEQKTWIKNRQYDLSGLENEIGFEQFLQYQFARQWRRVKNRANAKGIRVMGDIPFYVGIDSLDVWANQKEFLLEEDGRPVFIAGVPPDCFSAQGQRWGNPIYDWAHMEANGFRFWIDRLRYCAGLFDIVRVDHFRAFDTYWKVPASCATAIQGEWVQAPGYQLFDTVLRELPGLELVAEDLGADRASVYTLRDHYGFKGMKLMEFQNPFADPDAPVGQAFLPPRAQMAVYTGTHDNQTVLGWYHGMDDRQQRAWLGYLQALGLGDGREETFPAAMCRWALADKADLAILPMQDLLGLDEHARLNEPGTLGSPNWEWRLPALAGTETAQAAFAADLAAYGRAPSDRFYHPCEADPCLLLQTLLSYRFDATVRQATDAQLYAALLETVKLLARSRQTQDTGKKVYYISAEFLLGRMLTNNLINLGAYEKINDLLHAHGRELAALEELEPEPSLGNGGLGRLAACFLDSIASMGLNGDGVGLNYHLGLFRQQFRGLKQQEEADPWLTAQSWLKPTDTCYPVQFGDRRVQARMYDLDVVGYQNRTNTLHLFDIETVDEGLVQQGIGFDKTDIEKNLTLFLYPDDSDEAGRLLRVYQQYFLVSCAAQLILEESAAKGSTLHDLDQYAVVQINDTHPSMVIPELIRLLTERGILFDEAVEIVSRTCAYTNHTILAEALEKWPSAYIRAVAPQLLPIIQLLDYRVLRRCGDERVAIIDRDDRIHMAHMDIHYGFSVNGVAALHTDILKNAELQPFYALYPEKFNNKTNGVTFRRWLMACNRPLTAFLRQRIGDDFLRDAGQLQKLLAYREDTQALEQLLAIKQQKKRELADHLARTAGDGVNPESVFDIQIKRLHEYKRQQMNVLYLICQYLRIRSGILPRRPITAIFGAKAAPAYETAKDIIHSILCLQELIDRTPEVRPWLKVVMVENYNVTQAEKLIPACELSEQISLASKEASGTSNMKFMLNGAVTLGTLDGANVEIADLVGRNNIYIFGASSEEVLRHYREGSYSPAQYWGQDKEITEWVDFLIGTEMLAIGDAECLYRLHRSLTQHDPFMTLLDVKDYIRAKDRALADYEDRRLWAQKMLVNIANAGYFSSDRTIAEYNRDIWRLSGR